MNKDAYETAESVRRQLKLPPEGRPGSDKLAELEAVFREAMAPDVPTYDVNSVQNADFDEWTYTEGLDCFMAFTQSIEINVRLTILASVWSGGIENDHAGLIAKGLGDKWLPETTGTMKPGVKVIFPPGNNLDWIVNHDNVLRAVRTDPAWMIKPHPITGEEATRAMRLRFGTSRIFDKGLSGMQILRNASEVGYTTATELGVMGMLLDKPCINFSMYERETAGRYVSLYHVLESAALPVKAVLNRLCNCPWSGIVPLSTPPDEALERFRAYKLRTIEMREAFRPPVHAWLPSMHNAQRSK